MEWGNFWSSHLPRTSYDIDLDDESSNRSDQVGFLECGSFLFKWGLQLWYYVTYSPLSRALRKWFQKCIWAKLLEGFFIGLQMSLVFLEIVLISCLHHLSWGMALVVQHPIMILKLNPCLCHTHTWFMVSCMLITFILEVRILAFLSSIRLDGVIFCIIVFRKLHLALGFSVSTNATCLNKVYISD